VTPRRLAWSLALGIVIGINPSVGITTLVVVLLAWTFGLNQVASQIGAHAMTPFLESDAAVITEWGGGQILLHVTQTVCQIGAPRLENGTLSFISNLLRALDGPRAYAATFDK
jgi:uncharacterized protein (DUF2062 family)